MASVSGGLKLDRALNEIARKLGRGAALRVGFLEGALYPNGTPVATVAAIQNFGAPARGIPPRPFFSNMVLDKSAEWPAALSRILQNNDMDLTRSLSLMGEGIKGQLQQAIRDTNAPPLKPATIARKGFDKVLIDTTHMINSVDYEVDATP